MISSHARRPFLSKGKLDSNGRIEKLTLVDIKQRFRRQARHCRSIVTVVGSGQVADPQCRAVGELIATLGFDLLTGGGGGVMEAVSRGFHETTPRSGVVIGVIPASVEGLESLEHRQATKAGYRPSPGYPNEWIELAIFTHLPDSGEEGTLRSSRNHINVLSADAIVALPGREGTWSEMWLALQYGIPIIAYAEHHGLPEGIARAPTLEDVRSFLLNHIPGKKTR
jgi:predicted Rossmann-fold nucleotide-binding protein